MKAGWGVVMGLLSACSAIRLSAQCPDGSPPPCRRANPTPQRVAVLYFDMLSPDSAGSFVAEGLTEELIVQLGSRPRLAVQSRTAVSAYRRSGVTSEALGRALGVTYLVSGSVRRSGPRWRITVELVQAATGIRIWGEQYDRDDDDPLTIQGDVAKAAAKSIADRLTRNLKAIARAQRGDSALARGTPGALGLAITEYDAAVRIEPTFTTAIARAALARLWLLERAPSRFRESPETLLSRATVGADSALRLDPTSSDGWAARGLSLASRQPQVPTDAQDALRRAESLDSQNVAVLQIRGLLLQRAGDDSGATAAWRRALTVDPRNGGTLYMLAVTALNHRQYGNARRSLDSAAMFAPTAGAYAARARLRLAVGDVDGARQDAEAARRWSDGDVMPGEATLALTEVHEGDSTEARRRTVKLLRLALTDSAVTASEAFWLAAMLTTLGAPSRALDVLEVARPAGVALWLEMEAPELDPLREDRRFLQLEASLRPR